ncbi:hypothetical protein ACWD25_44755, partial [Streptomyces sp. NPDC002920]
MARLVGSVELGKRRFLHGQADRAADGMIREAERANPHGNKREAVETRGRHLIGDRLEITGSRWGLPGAEAILRLRTLIANGDFD